MQFQGYLGSIFLVGASLAHCLIQNNLLIHQGRITGPCLNMVALPGKILATIFSGV